MYLIFDTETTGLPRNYKAPVSDSDNWPRLVQLAWQVHDEKGDLVEVKNFIVKPEGFTIPYNSEKIHGISTKRAMEQGMPLEQVLGEFNKAVEKSGFLVGHNIDFDINIVGAEFYRKNIATPLLEKASIDTKNESTDFCAIPGGKGGRYKWPTLTELHKKLFEKEFDEAHNAAADVEATARCFLELIRINVIGFQRLKVSEEVIKAFKENNPEQIEPIGLNTQPYLPEDVSADTSEDEKQGNEASKEVVEKEAQRIEAPFTHLHNHSQYSILQSTSEITALIEKAKEYNMPALAITDHANMFGVFQFVRQALKEEIKPIVGCEFNLCKNKDDKNNKDNGRQQVLIAKNKNGYHNLSKLCSLSYIEGFYYVPRIDKELLLEYKEDLMATTGGLYGEVPWLILNVGNQQAEEALVWWKEQFGEDFYIELLRHGLEEEDRVNEVLLEFAEKHDIKVIAANNNYYIDKEDAKAHDILLCVKDGEKANTPIGKGRGFRFGFPNDEFFFKSQEEMKQLFYDLPQAVKNTQEVVDKVEEYSLERDVLLPKFDIPKEFETEDDYLRHITYEGAKKRYGEISDELTERIDFELETIKNTGYPGYFLIVQDFTTQARKMGVSVGPGRGSAAGSVVAYCIGITNVDPIKYDLLFERFLNPDRVSLPDIDIDFDDEGRSRIIDWVVDKYGYNQVAQIITYGTMAAKSALRDTARVLDLPLDEADFLAKLVPDISLDKLINSDEKELKAKLNNDQLDQAEKMLKIARKDDAQGQTIQQATVLEGSVRNTGIHACGVIITPSDITEHIPVATSKDADLWITQYDNSVIENAGMLKMDFLGLKTLTIIKDAIAIIKEKHDVDIDPDTIPLDDPKTYELYQRGETNGTFQFESPGMQKHLRALEPDKFADLIAMNALYRPGPIEYIPDFIARKKGKQEITYDVPEMEEYLSETYGITVYQEQVMLLSQKLAGFSKGDADVLRKAMGKKIFALLAKLKPKFTEGCESNGIPGEKAEKIWKDWEAFAAYAFNKSHSTCYSVVAFHTAYLKANYPAEYMASVLTHNMNDIKKVTFFMEECKRMGVPVLGPDVNESVYKFTVNEKGEIRFGLGAIKGVGEGAVDTIVSERAESGHYDSIFDLTKRVNLKSVNKKTFESLALAGAFDSFPGCHRAQYFFSEGENQPTFLETAIKFGNSYQQNENSSQGSLFGGSADAEIPMPVVPPCEEWPALETLAREKEVVGIYISGHPLDEYKMEIDSFCNISLSRFTEPKKIMGRELKVGGIVTEAAHRISKRGNPYGKFTLEDYYGSYDFFLFSDDYVRFKDYLVQGWFLYMKGKFVPGKWDPDRIDFKASKIQLLSELREKLAKNLIIEVEAEKVTEDFINSLENITSSYEGGCFLKFHVIDTARKTKIRLASRSKRIGITTELIDELDAMKNINYKITE